MGNMTLALPDDLQRKMKQHREIRWSEVVRTALQRKIEDLELLDKLTAHSTLMQKDARAISTKIDASVARKLGLVR